MKYKSNKAFFIYLCGQGFSNFGDSIRLIAVTMQIFNLTGSGVDAATGIALSALASIIFSTFAGVLGDRYPEIRLLVLTDFVKIIAVPLFMFANNVLFIYLILILISVLDIFYGPSRKKLILTMTGREGAVQANSLLTGINGIAYLIGPLVSGALTDKYGTAPAILVASICSCVSWVLTIITAVMKDNDKGRKEKENVMTFSGVSVSCFIKEGIMYCLYTPEIRRLMLIGLVTGFSTISINLAFYPFAFDIIKVSAKGWGFMISVYYGANIIAMLIAKRLDGFYKRRREILLYGCLIIVSFVWGFYNLTKDYALILLLQTLEGTAISICGIFIAVSFQLRTEKLFMARVAGINDVISNIGRAGGICISAFLFRGFSVNGIFAWNSMILFAFAAVCIIRFRLFSADNISSRY